MKWIKIFLAATYFFLIQNTGVAQQNIKYNDFRDTLIKTIEGLNNKLPLTNISKNKILNLTIEKIDALYGNGYNRDLHFPSSFDQFANLYEETLTHYDNPKIFDWTLKKETDLFKLYLEGLSFAKLNFGENNKIISCIIEELMARYPKADFDRNDEKFIQEISLLVKTCARKFIDYENGNFEWNKYTIHAFKRQFLIDLETDLGSILDYSKIVDLSNYLVKGLINAFPKGLSLKQLQEKPVKDVIQKCIEEWLDKNL